ncbi:DUF932 domain-containing protein [Tundrisphaera lichenicola]|uniref:DUF932 domain-containing protein n=1 Tax=Tundrisphaera lichenicola TaxID=2029860 RepID=UPI003EB9E0BE
MVSQILSRDSLRTLTPSVFASTPWQGMSDSYRFIPTSEVLDMMSEQGFRVTSARQSRSRIEGKAPFTRHMLRLRHDSFLDAPDEVPEVVLVNSHDRSSAYRVFSGVFRLVCENGMIVQSADFGSFSIRHSGSRDLFAQVREATARIMDGVPAIMNRIADWKEVILPRKAQLIMAAEAFALKPIECIKPSFLLTARREADYTDSEGRRDLWKTTNVIQESLMRGGLSGINARGRKVTTRAVKAVDADLKINRRLWELAETFSLN